MGIRTEKILTQLLSDVDQCDLLERPTTIRMKRSLRRILGEIRIPKFAFMTAKDFTKVVDEMFDDGVVSWGRILVLYSFEYDFYLSNPEERIAARTTVHNTMMALLRIWIEENDPRLDDLVTRSCRFQALDKQ